MHLAGFVLSSVLFLIPSLYGLRERKADYHSYKLADHSPQYSDPLLVAQEIVRDPRYAEKVKEWSFLLTHGRKHLGETVLNGRSSLEAQREYTGVVKRILVDMLRSVSDIAATKACPEAKSLDSRAPCLAPKPRDLIFSLALAGSGARDEMCPFSDVDFFFIPQKEGTPLKASSSASTNLSPEGHYLFAIARIMRSFADLIGLNFCILAAPDDFQGDLIHTPPRLAGLINNNAVDMPQIAQVMPDEHIIDCVREARHVVGDRSVTDSLNLAVTQHLDRGWFKKQRDTLASESLLKYTRSLPHPFSQARDRYDIKKDFYRPIQKIASGLATYFRIDETMSSFDRIEALQSCNELTQARARQFQRILEAAAAVRILSHSQFGEEQDFIFLGSRKDYEAIKDQYPSFFVDRTDETLGWMHGTLVEALVILGKLKTDIRNFVDARNGTFKLWAESPF